jgi:WD40 repeat protein
MHVLRHTVSWTGVLLALGLLLLGGGAFNYGADDHHHHAGPAPSTPAKPTKDVQTGDNPSLAEQIEGKPDENMTGVVSRMKCDGTICTLAFSPDGRRLASGSTDKIFRMWDPATGAEDKHLTGHGCCVVSVSFAPDGKTVATASKDHSIRIWDAATGKEVRQIAERDRFYSVAYSPDGKVLASGGHDDTVRLWDPNTGDELRRMYGHNGWVKAVAFSPKGNLLASAGTDSCIRFWDPETGKTKRVLSGHADRVDSIAFSPDGSVLASGGRDGSVLLWDVAKGTALRRTPADSAWVHSVAFAPEGRLLATGGENEATRVWDPIKNTLVTRDTPRRAGVHAVAFSPDGQLLASGRTDGFIMVQNVSAISTDETTQPDSNRLGKANDHGATTRVAFYRPDEPQKKPAERKADAPAAPAKDKPAPARKSNYPPQTGETGIAEDGPAFRDALAETYANLALSLRSLNPSWAIGPVLGLNSATAGSFYVQLPAGTVTSAVAMPVTGTTSWEGSSRGIEKISGVRHVNGEGGVCCSPRRGLALPAASVACCNGRVVEWPSWLYTGTVRTVGNPEVVTAPKPVARNGQKQHR